ncbi:sugar transferase [Spirosoma radiotolerans]|uniref:Sugar transferase n=1 Tax=Spirosoma radiotolerans TaxID=1379870 RepID=A0A0E3V8R5_9BACT|nr:sugar transferase [Spirosoma radiotolerans]AKD56531.1 sugar transferase [Spirosoma radiotolerans]
MFSESTTQESDFRVMFVESDPQRSFDFHQTFSKMVHLTVVSSRAEALKRLQEGETVDLVVMNDALGGLKFLNTIDSNRIQYEFSTMLLSADAETDINIQAEGRPTIDVFPLEFDETSLRNRLTYLIRRKKYNEIGHELDNAKKQRIPLGKRLFDIALSFSLLLAVSPILIVVAILIRLDSKGPIFYKSRRIGMGYKLFDMYKFRTMRTGADKLIAGMASQNMYKSAQPEQAPDELCETCRMANTSCQRPLFQDNMQVCEIQVQRMRHSKAMFMKFKEDPRVTRLGKFLRNTSIDELPQFFNILKGDMSFVGNRPLPPYEAEKLTTKAYARRFAAPAGLTGLWQVTKRGKAGVSDQERIQLDALYAKTYSFKTDLIILLRTVKAVFQKENV